MAKAAVEERPQLELVEMPKTGYEKASITIDRNDVLRWGQDKVVSEAFLIYLAYRIDVEAGILQDTDQAFGPKEMEAFIGRWSSAVKAEKIPDALHQAVKKGTFKVKAQQLVLSLAL